MRVGLEPKQIKYLNSTAARLQPKEKEEMGFSGFQLQLQDAEACRSEAGDEENEQVVEPNEKEEQDSEIILLLPRFASPSSATRGLPSSGLCAGVDGDERREETERNGCKAEADCD